MDKRLQLILHEVSRQFRSERSFYQTIGITQRAWEKYKSGETNFSNIKLATYQAITATLFTRYETMLIDEAIQATNFNWYENVIDAFHDIKLTHAKMMLERGASIEVESSHMETGQPKRNSLTKLKIVDELNLKNTNSISFQISVPSHEVPSGKRNRQEWFDKYFDEVVVL